MEAFSADLVGLCEAMHLDRIALIGHSMGGRNGILFTASYPERIAAFTVVDVGPEVHPAGGARIRDEVVKAPERFDTLDEAIVVARRENPFADAEVIRRRLEHQTMPHPDGGITWRYDPVVRQQIRDNTRAKPPDLWAMWQRIRCPLLVVRGAETDVLSREILGRMKQLQPRCEVAEIPRAGHMVFEDNPVDFIRVASGWLGEHIRVAGRS